MISTLLKHELKNILREKMTTLMLLYPLILGVIGRILTDREIVSGQGLGLTAMLVTLFSGFAYGAMSGFSLLDDRDDQVLESIQISPVPVHWYIWFKVGFAYVLAVIAGVFVIWYTGALTLGFGDILLLAALSALQAPIVAFFINAFAKNKVEGFVSMKGLGFTLVFPIAGFFFLDWVEWCFAIAPAHWVAKAVQHSLLQPAIVAGITAMNLSFYQYVVLGYVYNLLLVAAAYSLFKRNNQL